MADLTTTSYAILGLLSVRPYSAYELAAQSQRSLRYVWPTAPSRLYAEPKRLVDEGLITVSEEPAGPTRTRRQYQITPRGRDVLATWLASEPAPPRVEAEILLRTLFADGGTADDLAEALRTTRSQILEMNEEGRTILDAYLAGENPFPERLHLNLLWIALVRDLYRLVHDWTIFAEGEVERWSDDDPRANADRARQLLTAIAADEPVIEHHPLPRKARPAAEPAHR